MAKNIVICSDGTGNSDIKDRAGTNVFKLYEAVDIHGSRAHGSGSQLPEQVAFYEDGVGTQSLLPVRLLGMAFGYGLSANVRSLYAQLARVYEPVRSDLPLRLQPRSVHGPAAGRLHPLLRASRRSRPTPPTTIWSRPSARPTANTGSGSAPSGSAG